MRLRFLIPLFAFLALAAFFYFGLWRDPSRLPSVLIGKPVPAFDLPPLPGLAGNAQAGFGAADLKGQVALVNFFASWCIPCKVEQPILLRLAQEERVPIYGVNYKDQPDAAVQWIATLGDPYTRIGADASGRVAIDWGVYGVPETFVVDREGLIRYRQVGPITPEDLKGKILPLVRSLRQ
jgi:cytochrome c biogenesis protein CcmG/thiol:disulfide interchange protein DsbE